MADQDETKNEKKEKDQQEPKKDDAPKKQAGSGMSMLTWIVIAAVVIACAGSGFLLGRLFAGSPAQATDDESTQQSQQEKSDYLKDDDSAKDSQSTWYYELDPVVANLDIPGATRFVRATVLLEISPKMDKVKGTEFLDKKKPVLKNWLAIYLASLSLEDATGARNLKRIQAHMLDAFNEELFPNATPQIKRVLFKEGFAIQ